MQLTHSQVAGLLRAVTSDKTLDRDDDFPDGRQIDGHQLIRLVGVGGMGRVYEARRKSGGGSIALKVLRPEFNSEDERRRFVFTANQTTRLDHPHIVRVLHVEGDAPSPYLTMDFVQGGPLLGERLQPPKEGDEPPFSWRTWFGLERAVPAEQRRVARLMAVVAGAVEHAHERGLLHRDLKPANILIDAKGQPRLVDFGLAKRFEHGADTSVPRGAEGTIQYMAPEQLRGGPDGLTRRADVYSLGATSYDLLCGRAPYVGPYDKMYGEILSDVPVPTLRSLAPWVHPHLEAICLKCLEKEPERRYASAADLAADLDSVAHNRPPRIPPLSALRRGVYLARRHPQRTQRLVGLCALIALSVALLFLGWQQRQRHLRDAVVANTAIASGQAGAALLLLRAQGDRVLAAAELPVIAELAARDKLLEDPGPEVKQLALGVDSVYVVSTDGYVRAQWPLPPQVIWERSYLFRDYFRGAKSLADRGARGVYVAGAFRSERDEELKFAVSAPIYAEGHWQGVLVAAIATDSVFGALRASAGDPGRTATLLGPRSIDRNDIEADSRGQLPLRYVTLIHEGLKRGEEVAAPLTQELRRAAALRGAPGEQFALEFPTPEVSATYRDAMPGYDGEWIAALSPVGHTGYVIVAQSRAPGWW